MKKAITLVALLCLSCGYADNLLAKKNYKKEDVVKFRGVKVIGVGEDTVTIEDKHIKQLDIQINENTKIKKSRKRIELSDINIGDKISANCLEIKGGEVIAKKIKVWKKRTYKKRKKK